MFLDASIWQALAIVGGVGAFTGLMAGFAAGAESLVGAFLMGVIGGIALATVFRLAGWSSIYAVGDDFSIVWAAVGGGVLGFVVGRSNV